MSVSMEAVFRQPALICDDALDQEASRGKLSWLCLYALAGSAFYGFTMGLNHPQHPMLQAMASAVKVPLLFLLTLTITLPTLHFTSLLFGSPLRFRHSLLVLLMGIAMTSILLGAFAPVSLLFLVSGSEYHFLLLMHVTIFAFCGAAGLYSVNQNYRYLYGKFEGNSPQGVPGHVLRVWMLLYMFVGTQTAYVLAPFIDREGAFRLFGEPRGNFYTYLWEVIMEMMAR